MVFIWARILAVDQSCQADLLKDNGYQYFINIFNPNSGIPIQNASEHRAMCAFIISMFCKDYNQGQRASLSTELVESCLDHLKDMQNPLLRQWSCLCLSKLWVNYEEAKWVGIRCMAHERLCELVVDPVAEVRAAMLHALASFLGIRDVTAQVANIEESIASMVLVVTMDGNSMVRRELLMFFSTFVARYKSRFIVAAYEQFAAERDATPLARSDERSGEGLYMKTRSAPGYDGTEQAFCSQNTIYLAIWKELLVMSVDPHPEIAKEAGIVVDHILIALLESPLAKYVQPHLEEAAKNVPAARPSRRTMEDLPSNQNTVNPPTPTKDSSYLSLFGGIRKSTSVGASLKSLWTGHDPTMPLKPPSKVKIEDAPATSVESRPHTPERYNVEEEPKSRGFRPRDLTQQPEIPLRSVFFEWSVEYFREPQMKPTEADEPGSTDYNGRLWRRNRNDKIIAETQPLKEVAVSNRWDVPRGYFDNLSQPNKMCFHQFEDHLVVTDSRDTVNIIDYSKGVNRINCFSNGNPLDSRITDVRFINEDDQALLMTGSSDGVIKIFRNYDTKGSTELVTGFRALTDLVPSNKNAGLVFDWQQGRGLVLVAGDVKVIRVWNAGTEVCTSVSDLWPEMPLTSTDSFRTCLRDQDPASLL
jgi:regulator-associated protein of mTOR